MAELLMSSRGRNILNGDQRREAGATVTFENRSGKTLVLHRAGSPIEILGALCDQALALDPDFRVVSYSTPQTIYTDLCGRPWGGQNSLTPCPDMPERTLLAKIGRYELLHPRLRTEGRHGRKHTFVGGIEW